MPRHDAELLDEELIEDVDDAGLLAEPDAAAAVELRLGPEHCGQRLDKAISGLLPQFSRSRLQQWIEAGHVLLNGHPVKGKTVVGGDETVQVRPQAGIEDRAFEPQQMALDILFEDRDILVLNKPAGLVVHPAAGNWSGTLLNGLLHHCPALGGVPRAGIVHRLDKDTTGLMVVAKTLEAHADLVRQLQARSVKREYLALVWGTPVASGRIDAAIGRHVRERLKMAVSESVTAKPALTHYERLAVGKLDGRPVTLVSCRLETGRTHQIRVHMQSIGFALVGDALYGKPHLVPVFPRQALHAWRLGLVHPRSREDCEWQVPLAQDIANLIARAGIKVPE